MQLDKFYSTFRKAPASLILSDFKKFAKVAVLAHAGFPYESQKFIWIELF